MIYEGQIIEQATDMSRIACPCGFEVVGRDEDLNADAFNNHYPCSNAPHRWHESVCSYWGALIAFVAFFAITKIGEALAGAR